MTYYLGIDGGGSKTTCVVGDDSKTLATATAGPSNVVRVGEVQARESLHLAVHQACTAAGIALAQVTSTCIGAAGAAHSEIADTVHRALAEILPPPIQVVGDMHIALQAAFGAGPGVIVIAGTGSIAYGRDAKGTIARAGGWGFAVSDEGSAHWIGRSAIAAVLRASDEQGTRDRASSENSPPLAAALLTACNVTTLNDLARTASFSPDFAALFPVVLAAAHAGDEMAQKVLTHAGTELARLAHIVMDRLNTRAADESVPLAMVGGVFRHAALVRQVFYNEIGKAHPQVNVNPDVIDPVEGALRLARKPS